LKHHRTVDPDGATGMAQLQREDYMWDGDEMFAKLDDVTGFLHYYVHRPVVPGGETAVSNLSGAIAAAATILTHGPR
jgi:hypothetical protein